MTIRRVIPQEINTEADWQTVSVQIGSQLVHIEVDHENGRERLRIWFDVYDIQDSVQDRHFRAFRDDEDIVGPGLLVHRRSCTHDDVTYHLYERRDQ